MISFLISSLALLLVIGYYLLIHWLLYHWQQIREWEFPSSTKITTSVSILIPARNEAANITACIDSLLAQDFPSKLMEIIVIDDHSDDATPVLVQAYASPLVRLIKLADWAVADTMAFKKAAIQAGVQVAKGELILTTDADCVVPQKWLRYMTSYFEGNDVKCIVGPVAFHEEKTHLERFQSLDFLGMMLITGAGIQSKILHMGNGANLAYPRAVFQAVNGFDGVMDRASGDDMFLLQKIIAKYPGKMGFLKQREATILTKAKPDLSAFIQQRIRWGTKNTSYGERTITLVAGLVFLTCWSLLLSGLAILWGGWIALLFCLLLWGIKSLADYHLLTNATAFFHRKDLRRFFWMGQIGHVFYIAFIGLAALVVKRYVWKGRRVE
ncbi:MAG: glycosyltransferase [Saprospiraceae bacterium]